MTCSLFLSEPCHWSSHLLRYLLPWHCWNFYQYTLGLPGGELLLLLGAGGVYSLWRTSQKASPLRHQAALEPCSTSGCFLLIGAADNRWIVRILPYWWAHPYCRIAMWALPPSESAGSLGKCLVFSDLHVWVIVWGFPTTLLDCDMSKNSIHIELFHPN